MNFTVRYVNYNDMQECDRVERETMGNYAYTTDAWNYFHTVKGGFICIYDEDLMISIGKFSVLHDGSGWLETLRVVPTYQGKGAGKLIYDEYLKLADNFNCQSIAMFTGVKNVTSAGLARRYGLETASHHRGYHLDELSNSKISSLNEHSIFKHDFKHVNHLKALELILPLKEKYNNYFTSNRTFYRINHENICGFADEGKIFHDEKSCSTIVCGARFQFGTTLHIPMMIGNYDKCIDFAINYALAQGINRLSCTFSLENKELEEALQNRNFISETEDLITMERVF